MVLLSDGGDLILESKYFKVHVGIGVIMLVGELEEMSQQHICLITLLVWLPIRDVPMQFCAISCHF